MPKTAFAFGIGTIAICGLPPLNGFISEFLLYYGSLLGIISSRMQLVILSAGTIACLSIIGGFALAAFTKVFGIVFLGESRSEQAEKAHESNAEMYISMWILAGLCILTSLIAPFILPTIILTVSPIIHLDPETLKQSIDQVKTVLYVIISASIIFVIFVTLFLILRQKLLKRNIVTQSPTWDCGYIAPTPRMQYTSSSFSQPIVDMFKSILFSKRKLVKIKDLFPKQVEFESHTPDVSSEYLYRPIFKWIDTLISKMRWVQYGVVQMYVLYIAITLIILLVWKLR